MLKSSSRRDSPSDRRTRKIWNRRSSDEEMDNPRNTQQNGTIGTFPALLPEEAKPAYFAAPNVFVPSKTEGFVFNPIKKEDVNQLGEQNQPNKKPENTLFNQYEEKIRPCIDLIDSLRALGVEKDLALPAIAVIGDQSSGKSSVLEALSGVALPRGSGIVTRCPLELRLKKLLPGEKWNGKISYLEKNIELANPSMVEIEIRKAQNIIAGDGLGISDKPISLEIRSPQVPDLTLIDLPGIARVAVGNQPVNIGDQIKKLIKTFIDKQETINLVVVPSNVDIATTEALKMAQEVDPNGERTLGIMTKPDLMDRGTEVTVVNIVRNQVIPLKKGYMIVKCRGQQDIQSNMTLASAIKEERAFFEKHKCFSILLQEKKATVPLLAEKLTSQLVEHINKSLPTLEEQISFQLQKTNAEMQRYGKGMPKTDGERQYFLTEKIQWFNADVGSTVQGEEKLFENEARLFTKVRKEFQKWGKIVASSGLKIQESLISEKWKFENQYRGRELPGFINYKTFEMIIRDHITKLEMPALETVARVTEIVRQGFVAIAKCHFEDFHYLHLEAKNRIESIREKQAKEAEATVKIQFAMEQTLYCQDKFYQGYLRAAKEAAKEEEITAIAEEGTAIAETGFHLEAYFKSATKRLSSQIPLVIQYFILKKYGDNLQNEMMQLLQQKEKLSLLTQERADAAEQRQFLSDRIDRLAQARDHLARFLG
ncbi:interferon-induced GTP-binding protein Mx2-like [Lacerta agilis]|uniref:interferon-induced GTP-binding protein Mx2-like n=1 Tax=Lacerta agilis TaxID=80427 RepID=UPI001419581B|nr:interferon-induced GTP-binding protein Mx2-like [Lacerta agilis]XP_033002951.1 interferon-induced GTP-binding protein Mx2-like [Lacerta agilis]